MKQIQEITDRQQRGDRNYIIGYEKGWSSKNERKGKTES